MFGIADLRNSGPESFEKVLNTLCTVICMSFCSNNNNNNNNNNHDNVYGAVIMT